MIPKKVLLAALHEILEAAGNPETFARAHGAGAECKTSADAMGFALGWIHSAASHALGLPEKTFDLMAALRASLQS